MEEELLESSERALRAYVGTAGDSHLIQVPSTGYDDGGRRLADGGVQLKKGLEELDLDDEDPRPGGGRPKDVWFVF